MFNGRLLLTGHAVRGNDSPASRAYESPEFLLYAAVL
jgi:hypothetical protein